MRKIESVLKSKQLKYEEEKPIRWPFMKVLRESNWKQFYPEIDPYVEVYQYRDNMYCMYCDSLDGHGDPWMYLIVGPENAMLIDTGFGLGDLKGLCDYLSGSKELIVVNTHSHPDHAGGNPQFPEIWCHVLEKEKMESINNPNCRDRWFDAESGKGKFAEFDANDLVELKHYEIRTFENHHLFDLGDGYLVEAYHLPGHSSGQTAFYDHVNKTLFEGDTTSCISPRTNKYAEYETVEALHDGLVDMKPIFDEISGVFPGHGPLDQSPIILQYLLDTTERIMKDPENYDYVRTNQGPHHEDVYLKCIYEGSGIRYKTDCVFKNGKVIA